MHLISAAVQNRGWLKFTDRIRPSLLPQEHTRLRFSSVVLRFPVFQDSGKDSFRIPSRVLSPREAAEPWAVVMKNFEGDGLKGSVWRASHWDTIPILALQTPAVPPSTAPARIPQHSLPRSLFSATSLPAPRSPDKPVHSADEESSLSSGMNIWQVNFKVAHGVEATESYTTVKKEKCCWINSASNGCVTENTLKIQALCMRRQALWFPGRNLRAHWSWG